MHSFYVLEVGGGRTDLSLIEGKLGPEILLALAILVDVIDQLRIRF